MLESAQYNLIDFKNSKIKAQAETRAEINCLALRIMQGEAID